MAIRALQKLPPLFTTATKRSVFCNTHEIYFSDLLNFFSRYLAEVLLGILTMESSLLYLVRLQGVLQMQ